MLATSERRVFSIRPQVPPRSSSIDEYYYSGMVGLVGFSNVYYATALNSAAAAGDDDATDGGGYFAAIETSGCGSSDDGPHDMQGNPFMHTWSLDVEEQYRCRAAHRAPFERGRRRQPRKPVVVSAGAAASSQVLRRVSLGRLLGLRGARRDGRVEGRDDAAGGPSGEMVSTGLV